MAQRKDVPRNVPGREAFGIPMSRYLSPTIPRMRSLSFARENQTGTPFYRRTCPTWPRPALLADGK